jgi:gamma-glutamylaminecyclotransferase
VRLFVYGSLLARECNHRHLSGAPFLGEAKTEPGYSLVDLGPYPALLEGGTTSVRGEVYEVDEAKMAWLDAFEGHPDVYRRSPVRLEDRGAAVAYVLEKRELAEGRPQVEGGDWVRHRGLLT